MHEVNERLAKAVRDRRISKGWTQANVNAQGGPSGTTQSKIEAGEGQLSNKTLHQLDAGLQWMPGSALALVMGGDSMEFDDGGPSGSVLVGHPARDRSRREALSEWPDDDLLDEIRDRLRSRTNEGSGVNGQASTTETSQAEGSSALEREVLQQLRATQGTEIHAVDDDVIELRVHLERDAAERAGIDLAQPDTNVVVDLPGHRPLPADLEDLAADRQKQQPEMERNTDLQHQAEAGQENQD